ncbi:phosphatase PAP2 family protein [Nonomuraea sp. NPDC004354]
MLTRLVLVVSLIPFGLLLLLARQPLNQVDRAVAHDLYAGALADPAWTRLLLLWTDALGPATWRIVVIAIAAWLIWKGRLGAGAWALTVIVAGGLLGEALKIVIDRARPAFPDPVATAVGMSFPSGHALTATLGAGVIVLLLTPRLRGRPVLLVLAWGIAAFLVLSVSYTRVALGVHWVSDVVAGMLLGVAVLAVLTPTIPPALPAALTPGTRRRSPGRAHARSPSPRSR